MRQLCVRWESTGGIRSVIPLSILLRPLKTPLRKNTLVNPTRQPCTVERAQLLRTQPVACWVICDSTRSSTFPPAVPLPLPALAGQWRKRSVGSPDAACPLCPLASLYLPPHWPLAMSSSSVRALPIVPRSRGWYQVAKPLDSPLSPLQSEDDPANLGFANLPDQMHRKAVKKGFNFTLMVVGKSHSLLGAGRARVRRVCECMRFIYLFIYLHDHLLAGSWCDGWFCCCTLKAISRITNSSYLWGSEEQWKKIIWLYCSA